MTNEDIINSKEEMYDLLCERVADLINDNVNPITRETFCNLDPESREELVNNWMSEEIRRYSNVPLEINEWLERVDAQRSRVEMLESIDNIPLKRVAANQLSSSSSSNVGAPRPSPKNTNLKNESYKKNR